MILIDNFDIVPLLFFLLKKSSVFISLRLPNKRSITITETPYKETQCLRRFPLELRAIASDICKS